MNYVLSNYPLSSPFRRSLEERIAATPQYLVVSELRRSSLGALLRRLMEARGRALYVATEDESSRALLPVLSMLGALSRVRDLHWVDGNLEIRSLRRVRAAVSALRLAKESGLAMLALRTARIRARALLQSDRIQARLGPGNGVAYLNCNLWFGVKAGGSVGHISGVVNALSELGHCVEFFSAGGRLLVDDRATHIPLETPRMLAMPFETTYYRFDGTCEHQIAAHMAKTPPAFIYQRMSLGNFTGVRLSRRFGVPLVLEYNGSEAWIAKNWGRPLRYHDAAVEAEDVCLRHSHVVVTVSDVLGRELASRGVEPERIVVYPNCIDPKMFDPQAYGEDQINALRAKYGFRREDVIATFIGTFGQWHGVDVLAQAIRQMIDEDREFLESNRLRFLLVGDGLKMPAVRQILGGAEEGPYVRLAGLVPQRDAPMYLAASDMLLSPHVANRDGTAFFGSPTKLFEYLAMGKAIVASDLDQLGDVLRPAFKVSASSRLDITKSAVAVLAAPGDIANLIESIKLLATNAELRSQLGSSARRLALAKYTWRHHVEAILKRVAQACRPDNPLVVARNG